MSLPLPRDYPPMEAKSVAAIPRGDTWQYEPKWDGFRCLVFRDGNTVELMSKSGQPLTRYFPEMVEALLAVAAKQFVLDGELIIADQHRRLDFDALLQRLHPAASRILKLSKETPATLMTFDLLVADRGKDLSALPLAARRERLEAFAKRLLKSNDRIRLSPKTDDFAEAQRWFKRMAGPLDGVIAKRTDLAYGSGDREAMVKIKNLRTADCVVGGFRYGSDSNIVASLLLGLYDDEGLLQHIGFTSGLANVDKPALTKKLEKLIQKPGFTGAAPGGKSRWSKDGRSAEWQPLQNKLVVEVQYDHFSGHRFRHGTRLLRWRPEKSPHSCLLAQVRKESDSPLTLLR